MSRPFQNAKARSLDYWTHRLETCDPSELDQLLSLVQKENPGGAALLRQKILTFERVVLFYPAELARFMTHLPLEEQQALYSTIRTEERGGIEKHLDPRLLTELSDPEDFPSKSQKQAIRIKTVLHFRNQMEEGLIKDFSEAA